MKKYQFNVLKVVDSFGKVWLYAKAESTESGNFTFLKFKPCFINYKRYIPLLVEQIENGVQHTMLHEDIAEYEVLAECQFDDYEEVEYIGFAGQSINHEGNE